MGALTLETIRRAPKVLLHDHLDGGLRPATVAELARESGYAKLPTYDVEELARWFVVDEPGADLVRYLQGFAHTTAVMQTRDELERVAHECALDLARDGVVYAIVRALLSAMRQAELSETIAQVAVDFRDEGVCGFDIAGPEDGFPPTKHLRAFHLIQREDFHLTIHAGEAFGLPSIWEAVQFCNAERLGHGVRIVDDLTEGPGGTRLGRLSSYVRDRRIPLEVCPTSNVHTGAAASIAQHPIERLRRLRFRVTVNTDNRLMSGITLSSEFADCAAAFAWTLEDVQWLTINAAKSAFYGFTDRLALIDGVIKPGFAALRAELEPGREV
ncbi:MAG: adenosine deaminase [Actinobacteria bacterium 21-73-9]|nr:MAG: adenosine deaminase [Actinobacteria bacterium 21-73-9]